ncbi:hypothetical protein ACIPZ8_14830 [Pseudomonas sp. NPDC089422]|uniref:hypothetical protein n=1 Tax=Pseudomonas sp. NPDC089422 TaxID=3364466 RepID=UPI003808C02E
MNFKNFNKSLLANTKEEYLALLSSEADWFVRSNDDLTALRASNETSLSKISDENFYEFLNSIEFKGGGLGHAVYSSLMRELTLTEIQMVFSYFGIGPIVLLDYQDRYCQSNGSCVSRNFAICTSSC